MAAVSNPNPKLAPWTIVNRVTALETPYYKIGQYTMKTASGVDATYYIHETDDSVLCVCVTGDNRILIERQYRPPIGKVSVDYPAGKMEKDDISSADAMVRELAEEAGFVAASLTPLASIDNNPGLSAGRTHIFLARGSVQKAATPEPTENIVIEFVPAAQVLQMIQSGEIGCAFCVSATFFAFQKLGLLQPGLHS
ncbi:MAG TPA: NUDIX hydrolase [Candidatus Saccharimonadales bacterium]|jgi:ADP-ribose pyrophosphatase|nr:NUDIX hydrolase [Candidatus Saccharimonadales bacterium]